MAAGRTFAVRCLGCRRLERSAAVRGFKRGVALIQSCCRCVLPRLLPHMRTRKGALGSVALPLQGRRGKGRGKGLALDGIARRGWVSPPTQIATASPRPSTSPGPSPSNTP